MPGPSRVEAAALIRNALGLERPPALRPVGEGGEHRCWWVGDRHVARFAQDQAAGGRRRRELSLRDLVRPYAGVPLPRSVAAGEWAPDRGFSVDVRLLGLSGELRAVSRAGEARLAALLRGLRSVPVREAAALGVPFERPVEWERLAADAEAARIRMAGSGAVAAAPLRPPPAAAPPRPVLVHADLKGEHLLVRPDGAISGVLDWTDAALAEPARDIAGLAISVGAPAAVRIATAAGYDGDAAARGVFLARCGTLLRLESRLRGGNDGPLPLLRRQLARAWEDSAR